MKVKVNKITDGNHEGDWFVYFDYLGEQKYAIWNAKIQIALKTEKSPEIGSELEVIRRFIKSIYYEDSREIEVFKIVRVIQV